MLSLLSVRTLRSFSRRATPQPGSAQLVALLDGLPSQLQDFKFVLPDLCKFPLTLLYCSLQLYEPPIISVKKKYAFI